MLRLAPCVLGVLVATLLALLGGCTSAATPSVTPSQVPPSASPSPRTATPQPTPSATTVTGWPTIESGAIVMTGATAVLGEGNDLDVPANTLQISVEMRGLAPGATIDLVAAGSYREDWLCEGDANLGEGLSPDIVDAGVTEGDATDAASAKADSSGIAAARLLLLTTARPAEPCPTDHPRGPYPVCLLWEHVTVTDIAHRLILAPPTPADWCDTF